MEPKTSRRIVSKGAYAKAHSEKAVSRLVGIIFYGATIFYILLMGWCIFQIVSGRFLADDMTTKSSVSVPILVFVCPVTYFLYRAGQYAFARAASVPPVLPLTRANTADLPAQNSLVRASAEPMQAQEGVLLRAAAESVERHEEQLVRASAGME